MEVINFLIGKFSPLEKYQSETLIFPSQLQIWREEGQLHRASL